MWETWLAMSNSYVVSRIDEVEPLHRNEWVAWWPARRQLGIQAFGVNVWIAENEGDELIGEHDEADEGHEELYVVVMGEATFTIGGQEVGAPAGTLVFVRPGTRRIAVARKANTRILAIGSKPGEAFRPTPWELRYADGDVSLTPPPPPP